MMQKMLGSREAENGIKVDELLQARASRHHRTWQNVENESRSSKTAGFLPKRLKTGRLKDTKEEDHQEGIQKTVKSICVGRIHGAERSISPEVKMLQDREVRCLREKVMLSESTSPRMKIIS